MREKKVVLLTHTQTYGMTHCEGFVYKGVLQRCEKNDGSKERTLMCTRLVIPLVPFHECYCYKKFGRFPTPVMAFNLLRVEVGKTPWMPYLALTFIDQYFSQMGTRNGDALTSLLTPDNETSNQLTSWSTIIDSVLSDHMCLKA